MKKIYAVYSGDSYDSCNYGYFKDKKEAEKLIKLFEEEEEDDDYWVVEEQVFEDVNEWEEHLNLR